MEVRRVTADIDNATELEVVTAWQRLSELGMVKGRVSSGGEGVHLTVFARLSEDSVKVMRRLAYDDTRRFHFDYTRNRTAKQVLFKHKPGRKAGPWRTELDHLIADLQIGVTQ